MYIAHIRAILIICGNGRNSTRNFHRKNVFQDPSLGAERIVLAVHIVVHSIFLQQHNDNNNYNKLENSIPALHNTLMANLFAGVLVRRRSCAGCVGGINVLSAIAEFQS